MKIVCRGGFCVCPDRQILPVMKFPSFAFLLLIVTLAFASCARNEKVQTAEIPDELLQGVELDCEKEKLKAVVILSELAKIRVPKNSPLSEADREKIHKLVERLKDKENLMTLALASRAFVSHSSGELECKDSSLIAAFDIAFWHCIRILAEDRSEENLRDMKFLKDQLNISNADGYDWSTIVDRIPMP